MNLCGYYVSVHFFKCTCLNLLSIIFMHLLESWRLVCAIVCGRLDVLWDLLIRVTCLHLEMMSLMGKGKGAKEKGREGKDKYIFFLLLFCYFLNSLAWNLI
jgi:hypothetical protein